MRVLFDAQLQQVTVENDFPHPAAVRTDPVVHLEIAVQQPQPRPQTIQPRGYDRIDTQHVRFATEPEKTPNDQAERDPRATGVHAPTAIERDLSLQDARVLLACLIAIDERGVGTR